ncbi:acetylglutamate kinase [Veillonella intestinalis]|uniref:acetylglutamate kinase n=1 Tax=Veillonella intestinalis TaxID=2941341 RepID=UPI002040C654|nr:acetylglutamate kinase [Veillonella intestinalis]
MINELNDLNVATVHNPNEAAIHTTLSAASKASILIEALPYIQKFTGKTMVIKYGGNAMISEELKNKVMQDIALMKCIGIRPVLVHGGGPDITNFLEKVGKTSSFVSGLRVTDAETVTIAQMVLGGKINAEIVSRLNSLGIPAIGLTGKDANLLKAHKKLAEVHEANGETNHIDIGFVGEVTAVNTQLINDLLDNGYVPVISPIGAGKGETTYNINADYVAAEVAGALGAEKLLMLTNTKGIYTSLDDPKSFLSSIPQAEAVALIENGTIQGGMIPKVEAVLHALQCGTKRVSIIDGREPHALLLELFTNKGIGTEII